MIDHFSAVARRLNAVRPVFAILAATAFGAALFEIFGGGIGERDYLPVALVGLLWSVLGFAAIGLFQSVPPNDDAIDSRTAGFARSLARGFFYLLATLFLIATVVGLYMSWKLLSVG